MKTLYASLTLLLFSQTASSFQVDFNKDIQPLLAAKCFSCHGGEVAQGGLRLDRRQQAMRGGDYGPVIIAGDSANSKLIKRVVNGDGGLRMPPTEALSEDEIGLLRAWIDQGADYRIEVKEEAAPKALAPAVTAFFSAIRNRDDKAVASMIAADPKLIEARDLANSTPLHIAAVYGTIATMKTLIDKGADVNAKNRRKSTPLAWALYDEARVKLLLAHGADVNARLVDGTPVLRQAAMLGNSNRLLQLLLDKNADPNIGTATGLTPLMAAANRGNVEAMQMLIDKGAKPDAKNAAGASALVFAAGSGQPAAVKLLLEKGADPNTKTKRGETALNAAATQGVEESVRLLIARGAKVNTQDERGYSPLMHAAASDAVPVGTVKLLLASGADTKLTAEYESTAASLAAKRGDTEIARLLGVAETARLLVTPVGDTRSLSPAQAVQKALPQLEKQSYNFIRIGGCNSCHAQDLASAAAGLARARSIPAPKEIPQLTGAMTGISAERILDLGVVGVVGMAWELFDLGMNQEPKTPYTDAVVHYIRAMQAEDGHWKTGQSRRPPMTNGDMQTAALSIYSLKNYTPSASRAESELAISKARTWLERQTPTNSQDRAFHLMGLVWAKASEEAISRATKALSETQHPEGGWAQLSNMGSDAYATGQALYALHTAGVSTHSPVYRKGISYLLQTQASDGTWHVKTRAIWLQPYFESGFPYGTDQFISAAGTAWASIALSLASDPVPATLTVARNQ
ncbi:MAG: ankyrin repeat domain-containing protein [Acidobacteria bacterium]|nr:ankyrin repeat domain-containing protein [Acidobacteriota bacterium]